MSVLKKPKRNIRRRDFDHDENEDDVSLAIGSNSKKLSVKSTEGKLKKDQNKPSILSFEEEWNDGK